MKVVFFDSCIIWVPHFETDLEIMEKHLANGDEVYWIDCNADLPFCQPNPANSIKKCKSCIKRKNKGLNILGEKVKRINIKDFSNGNIPLPFVSDITSLKKLKYKNLDVGLATVSSLVSHVRNPNPNLVKHDKIWSNAYKASVLMYDFFTEVFKSNKFDLAYIFNGRYAPERGFYRACIDNDLKFNIHERGRDKDHYMLYKNTSAHSREAFKQRYNDVWINSSLIELEKNRIGEQFFVDRAMGKEQFWISFVNDQKEGALPNNWSSKSLNVTIFLSSEDELLSISDEWKNPIYNSQMEGIKKIINDCPKNINFFLRIHPNLLGVKNKDMREFENLNFSNLTIIPASSHISTYTLLKNSNKVISFGSTVGAEATFWGTPSVLAGVSYYHGLDIAYDAKSHDDVIKLITKNLEPKNKNNAIKYGFYFKSFGEKYINYKALSLYSGTYKGVLIKGDYIYSYAMFYLSKWNIVGKVKRNIKKLKAFFRKSD